MEFNITIQVLQYILTSKNTHATILQYFKSVIEIDIIKTFIHEIQYDFSNYMLHKHNLPDIFNFTYNAVSRLPCCSEFAEMLSIIIYTINIIHVCRF